VLGETLVREGRDVGELAPSHRDTHREERTRRGSVLRDHTSLARTGRRGPSDPPRKDPWKEKAEQSFPARGLGKRRVFRTGKKAAGQAGEEGKKALLLT